MEKLRPIEIEYRLLEIGYDQDYLNTLDNSRLKSLYEDDFEEEIEIDLT